MRIRHRASAIDPHSAAAAEGFEHLAGGSLDVLSWLAANNIEFVLVGAVARAVRGDRCAGGPVAIVPAPYGRNIERLVRACTTAHARLRTGATSPDSQTMHVRLKAEKLRDGGRWQLRVGAHDLDIEGRPSGAPLYQDLLYEAERVTVAPGLMLEVGSVEAIELYDHVARTGVAPEIRVMRSMHTPIVSRLQQLDGGAPRDADRAPADAVDEAAALEGDGVASVGPDAVAAVEPDAVAQTEPAAAPRPEPDTSA